MLAPRNIGKANISRNAPVLPSLVTSKRATPRRPARSPPRRSSASRTGPGRRRPPGQRAVDHDQRDRDQEHQPVDCGIEELAELAHLIEAPSHPAIDPVGGTQRREQPRRRSPGRPGRPAARRTTGMQQQPDQRDGVRPGGQVGAVDGESHARAYSRPEVQKTPASGSLVAELIALLRHGRPEGGTLGDAVGGRKRGQEPLVDEHRPDTEHGERDLWLLCRCRVRRARAARPVPPVPMARPARHHRVSRRRRPRRELRRRPGRVRPVPRAVIGRGG